MTTVSPGFQLWREVAASGFVVAVVFVENGESAVIPQRPSVASAVSSWTCSSTFSTVLSSLRVTVFRVSTQTVNPSLKAAYQSSSPRCS